MKPIRATTVMIAVFFILNTAISSACTSVIASGRITPDGRPMMWKNRDSGKKANVMTYVPADTVKGTYAYSAIIDEGAKKIKSAWAGTNEKGFSIMNTMSYNIKTDPDEKGGKYKNGSFMKLAIESCTTVDDFETLLKKVIAGEEPAGTGLSSNFGLICNADGTGYLQKVFTLEDEILPPYRTSLEKWYAADDVDVDEIKALNKVADKKVAEFYKENFNLE